MPRDLAVSSMRSMLKTAPRKSLLALGLTAAAFATAAAPSHASNPCDKPVPPPSCNENPDPDPINTPPSASIGADRTQVVRGEVVTFTGDASDQEDGTPAVAYDVNHDGSFDDFGGQFTFTHSFSTLGDKVVRIRATDSEGLTVTKSITIKVVNRRPEITIDGPRELFTGETGHYTAVATDPDGDPVEVYWGSQTCRDIINGEGKGLTKDLTAPDFPTDTLPICAYAYDDQGFYSLMDEIIITVKNRKPIAAISFAPVKPVAGEVVTFDSSASKDDDGTIEARAWDTNGDGVFDDGTGVTAQRAFAEAGTHTAALKLTDDRGDVTVKEVAVQVAKKATTPVEDPKDPGKDPVKDPVKDPGTTPGGTTPGGTVPGGTVPGGTVPGTQQPAGPAANASKLVAKLKRNGKVRTLKVTGAAGPIAVACKGKGCAFKTKVAKQANLKGLFRKALKPGAKITVVTGDGVTVAKRTFVVKVKRAGKASIAIS